MPLPNPNTNIPGKGQFVCPAKMKNATLRAVITRADGTVEDLGEVSYYDSNPLKQLLWRAKYYVRTAIRKMKGK
jgi:hypothetical protein